MIFNGKVATLRAITTDDAEITFKWRHSNRAKLLQRGAQTVNEQKSWIAAKLTTNELNFIIEYMNKPVGMIALHDINNIHKSIQMGRLLIGEDEWVGNAPVAFEADMILCDYAFDVLGMHKMYGDVMSDNIRMLKTRSYLGWKQDGILREHYNYDGIYKDTVAISLLEDEYRQVCRPKLIKLISMLSFSNSNKRIGNADLQQGG
jgi:RimJ/RimL family protein N-acetyltransferase